MHICLGEVGIQAGQKVARTEQLEKPNRASKRDKIAPRTGGYTCCQFRSMLHCPPFDITHLQERCGQTSDQATLVLRLYYHIHTPSHVHTEYRPTEYLAPCLLISIVCPTSAAEIIPKLQLDIISFALSTASRVPRILSTEVESSRSPSIAAPVSWRMRLISSPPLPMSRGINLASTVTTSVQSACRGCK